MKRRLEPAGLHFFDRHSGMHVLFDEVTTDEAEWSRAPRYMSISLANACDLDCTFCFASKLPHRLQAERIMSWCRELDANGCFGIGFGGGEPTLYVGLASLCSEIHETTELAVSLTTHGHHFSPDLVESLVGNVSFIRVSMDGIGSTYEKIRGRSFAIFGEKIRLVRATAPFGVNYVVNGDTIGDLDAAADYAFSNGAVEMLLLPQMSTAGDVELSSTQRDVLNAWVTANRDTYRLAMSLAGAETTGVTDVLPINDVNHQAYEFLHIDAGMMLKFTAFHQHGIDLVNKTSLIDAIDDLRKSASALEGSIG